ncbi:MAG: hypothetical protein LBV72_12380 [Tannerella sp.]|nr:hypothetical protein [Tannerella sp.]
MTKQSYFGQIKKGSLGFSAEHTFEIPYFETYNNATSVKVCLGEEYDENWKKIEMPPKQQQLDEYEKTLKNFLIEIDRVIVDIQEKAFEYYKKRYADYYEKPFEVLFENTKVQETENGELHPPLNMDNKEKHFDYMKKILGYIRVLDNNTLKIPISYALDEEHGLELKIVNNKVVAVDGIAET